MGTIKRKKFLKRSSVKPKRSKPRRGRLVDLDYLAWMSLQPCLVSNVEGEEPGHVTIHHVRQYGSPRNDRRTIPLLAKYHLHDFGPESIERLGKAEFERRHGVNIEAAIKEYNRQYEDVR